MQPKIQNKCYSTSEHFSATVLIARTFYMLQTRSSETFHYLSHHSARWDGIQDHFQAPLLKVLYASA